MSENYNEDYVWYVAYGSNLLTERLRYYIQGGTCPANEKFYPPCTDTRMPAASKPVMLPYSMFYANFDMGSWRDSAVCFLDIDRPGRAYGRAYLVTKQQLAEIHRQEGTRTNWYPETIRLDDIDGLPAYTFAGHQEKRHEPFSRVSAEYGLVLYRGMEEAWPELSGEEIISYLRECGRR